MISRCYLVRRSLYFITLTLCFIATPLFPEKAEAQLPRERAEIETAVTDLFWAPANIGISTVQNVSSRNLSTSVAHIFGLLEGGIDRFFGLDDGANTRLGLDYGLHDRFSIGLGRMTFNNVVDIRGKYNLVRQTTSGSNPVEIGTKIALGIRTLSGVGLEFPDRLSYFGSFMIAKKINTVSIQVSPMAAYFNSVAENNRNLLFGLGLLAQYKINDRFALSAEYLPVIGKRNAGTADAVGIALNIDTGGHVFQLFLTTSQWHNEQYIMANNRERFWDGDLRFGFNIHRIFGL